MIALQSYVYCICILIYINYIQVSTGGGIEWVGRERVKGNERPMLHDDECGGVVAVIYIAKLISMQFLCSAGSPRKRGRLTHILILYISRISSGFFNFSFQKPVQSHQNDYFIRKIHAIRWPVILDQFSCNPDRQTYDVFSVLILLLYIFLK